MCGVAGWINYGEVSPSRKSIRRLFKALSIRGKDATGMAYYTGDTIRSLKAGCKASSFINRDVFKQRIDDLSNAKWALIHTRAATHGTPFNNFNNHPIMNDHGLLIHNGIVSPKEGWIKGKGESDSEQILLYMQKYGFEGLSHLSGRMAVAYSDYSDNGFYLFRNTFADMVTVNDKKRKVFFFCSTEGILNTALKKKYKTKELPANTVYHVDNNGKMRKVYTLPTPKYQPQAYPQAWYMRHQQPQAIQTGISPWLPGNTLDDAYDDLYGDDDEDLGVYIDRRIQNSFDFNLDSDRDEEDDDDYNVNLRDPERASFKQSEDTRGWHVECLSDHYERCKKGELLWNVG